jgi:predicted  nucleic acid-binding Zn-ribbon protein
MKIIDTQAGDDSEGKMWGLEGGNLFIAIGGFILGVTVALWMFAGCGYPPMVAMGYGAIPAVLGIVYIVTLREGRPKAFDKDLLRTFIYGRSWKSQPLNKSCPLTLAILLLLPLSSWAQFIPSQHSDVQSGVNYEFSLLRDEPYGIYVGAVVLWTANGSLRTARLFLNDQEVLSYRDRNGDTGSGRVSGVIGRIVPGPLKAGTKIRLKGVTEAPHDPSARLFALSASAVSYDAAVNLSNLERQLSSLEAALLSRVNQNASKITEISTQLANLKSELNQLRQHFEGLELDYRQFKEETLARLAALDGKILSLESQINEKIAALEKSLRGSIKDLSRRFDTFVSDNNKFKKDVGSQFGAINSRIAAIDNKFGPLDSKVSALDQKIGLIGQKIDPLGQRLSALERRREPDLSGFERRISRLEKRKQTTAGRGHSDIWGIIGTSLGGTATLLAGASLYQAVSDHGQLHEKEANQDREGHQP